MRDIWNKKVWSSFAWDFASADAEVSETSSECAASVSALVSCTSRDIGTASVADCTAGLASWVEWQSAAVGLDVDVDNVTCHMTSPSSTTVPQHAMSPTRIAVRTVAALLPQEDSFPSEGHISLAEYGVPMCLGESLTESCGGCFCVVRADQEQALLMPSVVLEPAVAADNAVLHVSLEVRSSVQRTKAAAAVRACLRKVVFTTVHATWGASELAALAGAVFAAFPDTAVLYDATCTVAMCVGLAATKVAALLQHSSNSNTDVVCSVLNVPDTVLQELCRVPRLLAEVCTTSGCYAVSTPWDVHEADLYLCRGPLFEEEVRQAIPQGLSTARFAAAEASSICGPPALCWVLQRCDAMGVDVCYYNGVEVALVASEADAKKGSNVAWRDPEARRTPILRREDVVRVRHRHDTARSALVDSWKEDSAAPEASELPDGEIGEVKSLSGHACTVDFKGHIPSVERCVNLAKVLQPARQNHVIVLAPRTEVANLLTMTQQVLHKCRPRKVVVLKSYASPGGAVALRLSLDGSALEWWEGAVLVDANCRSITRRSEGVCTNGVSSDGAACLPTEAAECKEVVWSIMCLARSVGASLHGFPGDEHFVAEGGPYAEDTTIAPLDLAATLLEQTHTARTEHLPLAPALMNELFTPQPFDALSFSLGAFQNEDSRKRPHSRLRRDAIHVPVFDADHGGAKEEEFTIAFRKLWFTHAVLSRSCVKEVRLTATGLLVTGTPYANAQFRSMFRGVVQRYTTLKAANEETRARARAHDTYSRITVEVPAEMHPVRGEALSSAGCLHSADEALGGSEGAGVVHEGFRSVALDASAMHGRVEVLWAGVDAFHSPLISGVVAELDAHTTDAGQGQYPAHEKLRHDLMKMQNDNVAKAVLGMCLGCNSAALEDTFPQVGQVVMVVPHDDQGFASYAAFAAGTNAKVPCGTFGEVLSCGALHCSVRILEGFPRRDKQKSGREAASFDSDDMFADETSHVFDNAAAVISGDMRRPQEIKRTFENVIAVVPNYLVYPMSTGTVPAGTFSASIVNATCAADEGGGFADVVRVWLTSVLQGGRPFGRPLPVTVSAYFGGGLALQKLSYPFSCRVVPSDRLPGVPGAVQLATQLKTLCTIDEQLLSVLTDQTRVLVRTASRHSHRCLGRAVQYVAGCMEEVAVRERSAERFLSDIAGSEGEGGAASSLEAKCVERVRGHVRGVFEEWRHIIALARYDLEVFRAHLCRAIFARKDAIRRQRGAYVVATETGCEVAVVGGHVTVSGDAVSAAVAARRMSAQVGARQEGGEPKLKRVKLADSDTPLAAVWVPGEQACFKIGLLPSTVDAAPVSLSVGTLRKALDALTRNDSAVLTALQRQRAVQITVLPTLLEVVGSQQSISFVLGVLGLCEHSVPKQTKQKHVKTLQPVAERAQKIITLLLPPLASSSDTCPSQPWGGHVSCEGCGAFPLETGNCLTCEGCPFKFLCLKCSVSGKCNECDTPLKDALMWQADDRLEISTQCRQGHCLQSVEVDVFECDSCSSTPVGFGTVCSVFTCNECQLHYCGACKTAARSSVAFSQHQGYAHWMCDEFQHLRRPLATRDFHSQLVHEFCSSD